MREVFGNILFAASLLFLLAYYTFLGGKAWTLADQRVADEIARVTKRY